MELPHNMSPHKTKTCLITGASRGLGKALTHYFWQQGWSLILISKQNDALQKVAHSLKKQNNQSVHVIRADLSKSDEINHIVATAQAAFPKLDLLINNAAIQGPIGPLFENDASKWKETIQINLLAPVELCRLIIPWMKNTGGGSIINFSGGGATSPRPNFSAYAASKAGLVRFSETLAEELKPYNIFINCIAPGPMPTAMLKEIVNQGATITGQKEYENAAQVFTEEEGVMQRVAELCLFLASERAVGITGKLISAVWDKWEEWSAHIDELQKSDVYTLRRITGRDRGFEWGDK
jgi:NAD(P)-dependent dehydrogenase (short-subunit alcohol dehydrogenase family)